MKHYIVALTMSNFNRLQRPIKVASLRRKLKMNRKREKEQKRRKNLDNNNFEKEQLYLEEDHNLLKTVL